MKSMKNYDSAVLKDKNNLYSTNVFLFFYFIFFLNELQEIIVEIYQYK